MLANQPAIVNRISFQFVALPSSILARPDLGSTGKILFAVILDAARRSGACRLSNRDLALSIRLSESEVNRRLAELERLGLIRRVFRGVVREGIEVVWAEGEGPQEPALPESADTQKRGRIRPPATQERGPNAPQERGPSVLNREDPKGERDAPTILRSLPGKPENVPQAADRLIEVLGDDPAFRRNYLSPLGKLASGETSVERGIWALAEASKRPRKRGLAFLSLLESTTPILEAKVKPRADDPEVAELLVQGRHPDARIRSAANGSLLAKGFSLDELRDLFARSKSDESSPPPAPVRPEAAVDSPFSADRRWWRSFIVSK